MAADTAAGAPARLIAMGRAALMEGFSLVGLETYPDATPEDVERVLGALVRADEKALVLLEHSLARAGGDWLARVREEAARIVITEIPPLHEPQRYAPSVDRLVRAVLGPGALGERA